MIAITGMHRSGTSCITGLLERCGYELGTSHPLLHGKRFDNEKGHFENLGALAINETILRRAGGSWCNLPNTDEITIAGIRNARHIREFSETFNGDIFKDPRTCVTASFWERYCKNLFTIVFCLRNPIGVAVSLKRRDGMSIETGLQLWYEYNIRFLDGTSETPVVYVDYDNLKVDYEFELINLLEQLDVPLTSGEILMRAKGFFDRDLNHDPSTWELIEKLPKQILRLYKILLSKTAACRAQSAVA